MNLIILFAIVLAVFFLSASILFLFNSNEDKSIRKIIKAYPQHVAALLYKENVCASTQLTDEDKKKILSLSDHDWVEWNTLLTQVSKIAERENLIYDDFVSEIIPTASARPLAQTKGKLFVSVKSKRNAFISALTYAELKLIIAQTSDDWEIRRRRIDNANSIKKSNPEGMNTYSLLKKKMSFTTNEILRDRIFIEQLDYLAQLDNSYSKWESRQEKFSSKYYDISKTVYPDCGRYVYDIQYKHPSRSGELTVSGYKIWQSFSFSFSSYHLDEQSERYIQSYKQIEEFKNCQRYFYESVYDSILSIIKEIEAYNDSNPLIVLINNCNAEWETKSYDFHYRRLRKRLKDNNFFFCNIDELAAIDSSEFSCVYIIDFITTNEELFSNCNLIISFFGKNIPTIGYHSFIKEYSEKEILEIIAQEKKNAVTETVSPHPVKQHPTTEDNIVFSKQILLKINKHPFFAYTALINLLAGTINGSSTVKQAWLDNPKKYIVELKKNNGVINCKYSTDYGASYMPFQFTGDTRSADDVAKFMYNLFNKMGVWDQFRKNAEEVVSVINRNGYLSHH